MSSLDRNGYVDQWRGISVLMVIANHLLLFRYKLPVDRLPDDTGFFLALKKLLSMVILWSANAGNTGVCVFFVMSGFLITSLLLREEEQAGQASLTNFVLRRTFRIFPAVIVFLTAIWVLDEVQAIRIEPLDAFGPTLFLCNSPLVNCGHLGHFWSLAVEEQFYLAWPVLFIFARRSRKLVVASALVVALAASTRAELRIDGWLNNGLAFSCVITGVLFALSSSFRAVFKAIVWVPRPVLVFILAIFLPYARTRWGHYEVVYALLLPFLIVATVLVRKNYKATLLAEMLRYIGLFSFSLYLWHAVFTWTPESYLMPWFETLSMLGLPAAWLSYRYVEIPMIAIGRRVVEAVSSQSQNRGSSSRMMQR